MATFKELTSGDIKSTNTSLSSLIDIIQEDISGSSTRKSYAVFATGGIGPGTTSSMFQTIFDQDYTLQTANAVFDITVGLYASGSTVTGSQTGIDSAGKLLFSSQSMMMREKVDIYRNFSQQLLGDASSVFHVPVDATTTGSQINEAMFLCFKRLFTRDRLKRETFALKFYQSASKAGGASSAGSDPMSTNIGPNLGLTSESGSVIFTDVGSATNKMITFGGEVGTIVDSANTSRTVGLMFYDRGVAVMDLNQILSASQHVSGTIDAMSEAGTTVIGRAGDGNLSAKFIPDFMVSASIDDIVDHLAATRFSSGSQTAMTFQNVTNINSTLIFARMDADDFNYSSNPTYVDDDNRIQVIDPGQEQDQRSFTFITTIGLYDANDNLLAVGKVSRPLEKNNEKSLTLRLRLDF